MKVETNTNVSHDINDEQWNVTLSTEELQAIFHAFFTHGVVDELKGRGLFEAMGRVYGGIREVWTMRGLD